ncbi:MAG: HD-GYP domain-containing protein [Deltaproteobacteria bacterium]|jgi:HD-GYP domain-containing protein (c-di-GMP phosphodiesterase class II)|nr:HD-GYP domain-containing protein [Deltaproteobacteria bacterium]
MLRKLPINSLQPGMYITDYAQDSIGYPLLYCTAGMLESAEDIEEIREYGYMEALVDLGRSDKQWLLLYGGSDEAVLRSVLAASSKRDAPPPRVTLQEALPQAKQLYAQTLHTAQRIMENFRNSGQADIEAGNSAVEGIVESVSRNASALLAIAKLRTQDDYTYAHCINVATEAVIFARHLGYDGFALHTIGLAGLFHDLGKMEIPLDILNSPRRLTAEEFSVMRRHPAIGGAHLKKIPGIQDLVVQGALEHHERVNGKGYPDGKRGDEISLAGKVLAVVDVYDALSSRRVYKDPMAPHSALGLLYGMRGEDFVPELVERFIQCIGIYPSGSLVQLNNNHLAVVSQVDADDPLKPQLILIQEADGRDIPPRLVDMKTQPGLQIMDCLDPRTHNLDPLSILERHAV